MNLNKFSKINRVYLSYIAALLIFGTNGILVSNISLEGSQIVLMRTLIGGLFLTAFVLLRGGFDKDNLRRESVQIILGGAALGLNWVMLFSAYRILNVSISTLIYYAGPILVLLFSPVLLNESLTQRKIISVIIVAVGLICISGSVVTSGMNLKGLIFAILSAIFYAMLIIFNKKISLTSGLQTAAIELDIAFLVVLIYVLVTSTLPKINSSDLPYIAIIGLLNTGIAYLLYFYGIQKLSGQSVALLSYVDPVSALIFSSIFLNETMSFVQIIGSILIIGGAIYGEIKISKK
ncbi:DMT family transporter [Peptoniphilus sp.]|jgi:drug/metabolite transporter (DMT)-like permease|uniref:DMT family transporter n=1 Tax=Peptoniphilus sp. TaxID=1971214 RepID=UPI003D9383B2